METIAFREPEMRTDGPPLSPAGASVDRPDAPVKPSRTIAPLGRITPDMDEGSRPTRSGVEQLLSIARRHLAARIVPLTKGLATMGLLLIAGVTALMTWDYYVTAPWTRDGSVRVQVASVAPQISGQITELHVADNQFVHKGDVLYVIDPFDFQVALHTNRALLQQKAADLQVKKLQSERRQHLSSLATTAEEQQTFAGSAIQAKAAFDAAQQQVALAEINLRRTEVRSPVNGYVTNLLLRVGDYAHQGAANISVIDTDSYWIDGYFEETKMAHVCVGSPAEAKLMGYAEPILGHVATVTRGIGVANAKAGVQGLPTVDPVYTWVRLAQRVPVRIAIDRVPSGVPLVSGMTATVTIRAAGQMDSPKGLSRLVAAVKARLSDVLGGPSAQPGCIPATTTERAIPQTLEVSQQGPGLSPEQINPGLATGLRAPPKNE